jgi:hypothetical protein
VQQFYLEKGYEFDGAAAGPRNVIEERQIAYVRVSNRVFE